MSEFLASVTCLSTIWIITVLFIILRNIIQHNTYYKYYKNRILKSISQGLIWEPSGFCSFHDAIIIIIIIAIIIITASDVYNRFNKNVIKNWGWVIVGFFSYFTNLLRSKSNLLVISSYIDFSIFHVIFPLRNLAVFGFFAFTWTSIDVKFHAESDPSTEQKDMSGLRFL